MPHRQSRTSGRLHSRRGSFNRSAFRQTLRALIPIQPRIGVPKPSGSSLGPRRILPRIQPSFSIADVFIRRFTPHDGHRYDAITSPPLVAVFIPDRTVVVVVHNPAYESPTKIVRLATVQSVILPLVLHRQGFRRHRILLLDLPRLGRIEHPGRRYIMFDKPVRPFRRTRRWRC
jgi:hypothetical protein